MAEWALVRLCGDSFSRGSWSMLHAISKAGKLRQRSAPGAEAHRGVRPARLFTDGFHVSRWKSDGCCRSDLSTRCRMSRTTVRSHLQPRERRRALLRRRRYPIDDVGYARGKQRDKTFNFTVSMSGSNTLGGERPLRHGGWDSHGRRRLCGRQRHADLGLPATRRPRQWHREVNGDSGRSSRTRHST